MKKATQFLILSSSLILLLLPLPVRPAEPCKPASCNPARGPEVRFPFRLRFRQPSRCGYPGFNLRCDSRNQTILNLPRSGDFVVHHIDYRISALYIGDPGFCLPARSLNFSLAGSAFDATYLTRFGILNCSDGLTGDQRADSYGFVLPCLSTGDRTVMAVDGNLPPEMVPPPCRRTANVSVPPLSYSDFSWGPVGTGEAFELRWGRPGCGRCESRGGRCGFKEDGGIEVKCYGSSGLPRGARYAIIIGVGIPGLICALILIGYAYKKMEIDRHQRRRNDELSTTSIFDRQLVARPTTGLDLTTIESYPKTELGQSRRLPNPSDNTCSICLSDYQPKETLKSIPECNHYFHATCVDEWLKLNGTCPLCRNSPETNLSATPSSSSASSPSPSSTPSDRN